MTHLEYFKKQSKNLFHDWESHTEVTEEGEMPFFEYHPKFFNIEEILFYFYPTLQKVEDFTLMKAQHIVAKLAGFKKWNDLIKATDDELELAKIIFENCSKNTMRIEDWNWYYGCANLQRLDAKSKIEIAKLYFAGLGSSDSNDSFMQEEKVLTGTERILALQSEMHAFGGYTMDTNVECIHCGSKYVFKDVTVVRSAYDNLPMIYCKNYPECDGTFMDLMNLDNNKLNSDEIAFDSDMDQGYVDEFED